MGGTIKVSPSTLNSGASVTSAHGGTTDDLTNTLMNDFNTFLGLLSPIAGEPIVGPGATALMGALDQAGGGLASALACFGTGLKILAPAMEKEASSFVSLDNSLASTLKELEGVLPQVENYATSVKLIAPTATEIDTLKAYVGLAKQGKAPVIRATNVSIKIQAPHRGGFLGWLGSHKWAAWLAVGVVTVAGVALTPFTLTGSDEAAAGVDATIIGATEVSTEVATDAAVTTGASLVTVGGTEAFASTGIDATAVYAQAGMDQIDAYLAEVANNPLVTAGG